MCVRLKCAPSFCPLSFHIDSSPFPRAFRSTSHHPIFPQKRVTRSGDFAKAISNTLIFRSRLQRLRKVLSGDGFAFSGRHSAKR